MTESERAEISRQNGAKSRGPVTPEGKARSAQNSFKHGLYAEAVVLPYEEPEEFNQLQAAYHARFQPADPVEVGLVDRMVASVWRLNRAYCLETGALAFGLLDSELELEADYDLLTSVDRTTMAYQRASETRKLSAIERAITRIQREFKNAMDQLRILRDQFPMAVPAAMPLAEEAPHAAEQAAQPVKRRNEPGQPQKHQSKAEPATAPPNEEPAAGDKMGVFRRIFALRKERKR